MRMPQRLTLARRLSKHNLFTSPKLIAFGLALALLATAFLARQYFAVTAQEQPGEQIQLTRIAADAEGSAGVAHHQPTGSLLLAADGRAELMANDGTRIPFSLIGSYQGKLASARASKNGFVAGETFVGADAPGAITRISTDGSRAQNPWVTLPGEPGQVRSLFFDHSDLFNGNLIAVTTSGGVWRIDAEGAVERVTPMITARLGAGEEAPVPFESVTIAPNDPARYGSLAGKILAIGGRSLVYAIGADGSVESFDLGLRQTNNILIIPENENFFGVAIERQTASDGQTSNQRTIWGAAAANFAQGEKMAGDFLITQGGGEACNCRPTLWRAHWNGSEFEKTKLAEVPDSNERTEWAQAAFSPFGASLFEQTDEASQPPQLNLVKSVADLNGGVVAPGDILEYTLTLSNQSSRPVSQSFIAEFIPVNTTYESNSVRITAGANTGTKTDAIDDDQVDAFAVGGRVVQINIATGTGAGGHDASGLRGGALAPGESNTVVLRVRVNAGLSDGTQIVNGANWGGDQIYPAGSSNIVVSTVNPVIKLEKSVTDVNGGLTLPGDILEYKLTMTNLLAGPANRSFIAEFIPVGVTYQANSVQITAGPNIGAKTDAIDNDQVDYFPTVSANGQINIAVGAGAGGHDIGGRLLGGTLARGETTTATFRVRVNTGLNQGVIVSNGANAGANDIYPIATSNLTTTAVSFAEPLVGPFGQPAAVGPINNNDDFTRLRVNLNTSGGLTTETGNVRFINTIRNSGAIPGKFVVSAPAIPAGFSVRVSVDSGATFVSLNGGATATTPTDVNPNEERNLDIRIDLPVGLMVNTDYDTVIQVAWDADPTKFNRTIDRIRPDPNPPNLALVKAVRDLNGNDIAGGTVQPGQTIEYTLTLRNQSTAPVTRTFIAEYLPPNVTYVANSTRITAGPNVGAKTDARGDDQVDFFPTASANGQINIFTGTGAAADQGGTLAPGESTTVAFRVTINANAQRGTVIRNGADWGAEDFAVGGKSNIVQVTVNPDAALPLIGPFGQPAAVGPTDNNDDFTRSRINLTTSSGVTTIPGTVRFINTVRNSGTIPGRFIVTAPTIPAGFGVRVSADSGATFVTLNSGGAAAFPSNINPGEERNLDVRIELPVGLMANTDYATVIQVTLDNNSTSFNRTIDIVRVDPNPPNLTLVKAVRDLNGADIAGGTVQPGQTIEYTLTLRNAGATPVNNTFIAEYLPLNVTYVANSTRITSGPNAGPKTDARGDDQVDFFPTASVSGQINITTGTGATSLRGGTLAPGESTTVAFRVTINGSAPRGTVIPNGADWGAEDFGIGGKSNIVRVTVNPNVASPLIGPFGQPAAVGPTDNNDDFTRSRVNLTTSSGVTTIPGTVRFINTVRNSGTIPGRFIVTAPTIPAGFGVRVSVDSGATFVSLNGGATVAFPSDLNPGEERNLDVRIDLPVGLMANTDYATILQVTVDGDPTLFNRTIDIVRVDPNPPNLTLVKAVRDLNGNDIAGGTVQPGQTIEYTLTLRNAGTTPVNNTFIAEYLPANITYVANSTRITAGPNAGAKTDARGDDQVDFFPTASANGQINITTGTGATALRGGTLAPGESTTVAFRVTINANAARGTVIPNGADWGAEDFGIGGKSNIVQVTVIPNVALPLIGPFGQPAAVGPTNNNDDFTLSKVNLNISGGVTTVTGTVRFINTVRNAGTIPGRFIITAPTIPAGFSVRVSVDSGATFVSLNGGGSATFLSDINPGEDRNVDVRIDLPVGLMVNTDYDTVIQATSNVEPTLFNRTIDRVRPDPNAPNLTLVKAVRDLNGNDINGQALCAGQTIEYTLTLRNAGTTPVGGTFIAEYIPANVTYVANSTRITAGPNAGAKTDARGDDQVDYFPNGFVNGQINIFTGTGAAADRGGTLAPGESTTVAFRVTVNANTPVGTIIRNGADWGAEGFGIGGKSNIVEVTVGAAQAPIVTTQPANQTVCAGQSATFSVVATGANLTYQWRKGAVNIAGATSASFTISSVVAGDAGSYDVVITNVCGTVTSNAATLTVNPATAITTQPVSQTVCVGQPATFTVVATGANLTYQWRKNGVNIAGATGASFTIAATAAGDAGSYDVVVTGACGTVTSNAATLTVNPATAITAQPANQTVCAGQPATFTVTATGANLTYQWRKNGVNIAGATSNSFTIAATAAGDAGSYDAVVTGTCGAVTSNAATLTVNPATAITTQPANQTVCAGQPATFSVVATGANLTYQWRKGGVNIAGATGSSFTIAAAAAGDAGSYDVVVTGTCGAVTSAAATLTVNPATVITTQPANQTVCAGQSATFSVVATGASLTYQWRRNGVNIANATGSSFTIASTAAGDAGSYDVIVTGACGTVTSAAATLTVNPATVITTQPANQTVCAGQSATFVVTATGANLTYQWRRNGVNIAGATSSSFTIASTAAGDAGSYDVVVTGTCGAVTSNTATLTVNPATMITTQPANQTVCAGQSATFTVAATGAGLTYQWRKNGVSIAGATGSSFTIASVAAGDAGSYDVVVMGTCGTVTSAAATLTINPATAITTQPANQTVCAGQSATFTVAATGANLAYQWRRNGVNIAGATGSSFTIAPATVGNAGSYDVVVSGTCGAVTSAVATLTVNPATAITTQPANQTVCAGTSVAFTVTATGANLTYQWRKNGVNIAGATLSMFMIASATAGDAGSYDVVVTGTCGAVTSAAATLTVNQCPPPGDCHITICFRSARYFSLFWGTNEIPKGSVQVDGVNFGAPIPSTDPRVKLALDGSFGALIREHVAAQLNLLSASACGLGSAQIFSALQSALRCYGLNFNPVTVNNGAVTFTPETKLGDLLNYLNSAVKGSVSSRDACVLTKLLNGLNGDRIANVCHRPTSPIDFTSCN